MSNIRHNSPVSQLLAPLIGLLKLPKEALIVPGDAGNVTSLRTAGNSFLNLFKFKTFSKKHFRLFAAKETKHHFV